MASQLSWFTWCQSHPHRRTAVVLFNPWPGVRLRSSYLSQGYKTESQRNSVTGVRTHLNVTVQHVSHYATTFYKLINSLNWFIHTIYHVTKTQCGGMSLTLKSSFLSLSYNSVTALSPVPYALFGLDSLFNGISIFIGYLMPKPFSKKNSCGTI